MRDKLKFLAVFGLVIGGAVSANAFSIVLDSAGAWSNFNTDGVSYSFNLNEGVAQVLSTTGGLPELDNLAVTVNGLSAAFPDATAVAVYSNTAGTQTLTLDWTITDQNYNNNDFSMDGTWVYASGTGSYAGLSGLGTFANDETGILNPSGTGWSGTVLSGELLAVPEPASYAVLGLGVLGLIRRRKSA